MVNENIRTQILDGCLRDYSEYLAGNYRGYYITVEAASGEYIIKINANTLNDPANQQLNQFLEQYRNSENPVSKIQTYPYMCVIWIPEPRLETAVPLILNKTIQPVIDYLAANSYSSGCDKCGNASVPLSCYEMNGGHHFQCQSCVNELPRYAQSLVQNTNTSAPKGNFIAGLAGAFLGSLIGCVVWVLIYKLGYIAGIAGAITVVCAMKGYEILGGRLDKKGVAGAVVITIIMIYGANRIAWAWDAYDSLKGYGWTYTEVFKDLGYILEESDLTGRYIMDLAIGYVLTAIASFKNIVRGFRAGI